MSQEFDFDSALAVLQNGQDLTFKDDILTPLIKQLTEAALKAELETHLESEPVINRKNGYGTKTIKTLSGNFDLETPRDRTGTFEPQLVKKHQTSLTDEIELKTISMSDLGMRYRGTASHIA
jgi:putative transposase